MPELPDVSLDAIRRWLGSLPPSTIVDDRDEGGVAAGSICSRCLVSTYLNAHGVQDARTDSISVSMLDESAQSRHERVLPTPTQSLIRALDNHACHARPELPEQRFQLTAGQALQLLNEWFPTGYAE